MFTHQTIPETALSIVYHADNGKKGVYYLWDKFVKVDGEVTRRWFWVSMGHDGTCDSAPEATDAARDWIRNGTHGISSRSSR